jgi:uracil-DNA glycosylase
VKARPLSRTKPAPITLSGFEPLLTEIRACRVCASALPLGARPVVQASPLARLLIVGQAPGAKVHASGVPWNDKSGETLRAWLDIAPDVFYDAKRVAIMPVGFCYPGRGHSGDLPPRKECAELWHDRLLSAMPCIELTLLIGQHAQRRFLGKAIRPTLSETVAAFADYAPTYIPLPHPSPRNTAWFKYNPWFAEQVIPAVRERIARLMRRP